MPNRIKAAWFAGLLAIAAAILVLLFGFKEERVRLLYASHGDSYDRAAYLNFDQSLLANAEVQLRSLEGLKARSLRRFDAVYLDPSLKQSAALQEAASELQAYVEQGGHLYVENDLVEDLPLELLGASAIVPASGGKQPVFSYPAVSGNAKQLQVVFQQFAETFSAHIPDLDSYMPGFDWGKALVPSTAETIISMNGQAAYTMNRYGEGTVFTAGALLPNRYFITGFDLESGIDLSKGFSNKAALHDETSVGRTDRPQYFDFKTGVPLQPYFHFGFAAANHLFRNEYLSFVSKENLGYSLKRVMGPYGRPAMAFQNHFEALPGFEHKEGIAWAELLRSYNLIPSYSLVRAAFNWHQWQESIMIHLNTGTSEEPRFTGELPNSFYSSGIPVLSEGLPLTLAAYPGKQELAASLSIPYRAYPALSDLDGDGKMDLIVGSADGFLYRYANTGGSDHDQLVPEGLQRPVSFGKAQHVRLMDGRIFQTSGFSSVAAADLNADGLPDLVVGSEDGSVVALLQQDAGRFSEPRSLLAGGQAIRAASYSAPAIGDVNGDGIPDLIIGEANGQVTLYPGVPDMALQYGLPSPLFQVSSGYAAPFVRDMNGDRKPDLVIGNKEGDLLVYIQTMSDWTLQGPIHGDTSNPMGSHVLVGGQYSVPLWADLNEDGREDLIIGQVSYSNPIPLDDPLFPHKEELREFLNYAEANHLEIIPHVYVHNYLSPEQEKLELQLQKKMFAALGLPWDKTGTNQHTWRVNQVDRLQTLRSENEAGIWFNFGFKPSHSPTEPQWGRDFLWGFPFLLDDDKLQMPMMLHAPGFLLRLGGSGDTSNIYRAFAELDMPIDYFEHIEYHYDNPGKQAMLEQIAQFFDGIRTEYDYNFMAEPQMARSFLSAMKTNYSVKRPLLLYVIDTMKNTFGRGRHHSLSISADYSEVPDLAAEYRETAGVLFEPGAEYEGHPFVTDSPLFLKKGSKLYLGLGLQRSTRVHVSWEKEPFHIVRVNVPIDIERDGNVWEIGLNADGMQQIKLYGPAPFQIEGDHLHIEHDSQHGTYTVTHFGAQTRIRVTLP